MILAAQVPDVGGITEPGEPVIGSVCTGCGGLDLGVLAALGAGRIAWCADPAPHIKMILAARMPGVPNLGDIRALDWTAVEPVEVLTAGFPCQDISAAGRRLGIEKGRRSASWAGEGIDMTLTFLHAKRDDTRRRLRRPAVNLGIPALTRTADQQEKSK